MAGHERIESRRIRRGRQLWAQVGLAHFEGLHNLARLHHQRHAENGGVERFQELLAGLDQRYGQGAKPP